MENKEEKLVPKRIKLMVTIVDRGKGDKLTELYREHGATFHLICLGYGAADSEILDIFGFGENAKDIVLSVVTEDKVKEVMDALTAEVELNEPGKGIAFTIPINSVSGPKAYHFISGAYLERKV